MNLPHTDRLLLPLEDSDCCLQISTTPADLMEILEAAAYELGSNEDVWVHLKCQAFFVTMDPKTVGQVLSNGDEVGGFLEINGYCYLMPEMLTVGHPVHVALEKKEESYKFVITSDSPVYRTHAIQLSILESE